MASGQWWMTRLRHVACFPEREVHCEPDRNTWLGFCQTIQLSWDLFSPCFINIDGQIATGATNQRAGTNSWTKQGYLVRNQLMNLGHRRDFSAVTSL